MTPASTPCKSNGQRLDLRENLIKEIEQLKEQKNQVESELSLIQCQKEETEIERDSFKARYNKLNDFLSTFSVRATDNPAEDLKVNETNVELADQNKRVLINKSLLGVSIDELLSQNKYLNESNRNLKQEVNNLKAAKALSESHLVNKKYIDHALNKANAYLEENTAGHTTPHSYELIHELKSLVENVSENLDDKVIANNHQRKVITRTLFIILYLFKNFF